MFRGFLLTTLLALAGTATAAEPPSIESFARHAAYSDARISPSGRYLAISVDRGDKDVLTVLRLADMSVMRINELPGDDSVDQFQWISDERLVFTGVTRFGSYAAPLPTGVWYGVDADGSRPEPFIFYGSRGVTERRKTVGRESFRMLDPLVDGPADKVLMSAYYPRSSDGAGVALVEVDTVSGSRRTLARAPSENCSLVLDEKKAARYAVCSVSEDAQGNFDSHSELYRRGDDGKWTLLNRSAQDGRVLQVVHTADTGRIYAFEGDGRAPAALGTLDPASGEFATLLRDPVADVGGFIVSPTDGSILAAITEAGVPRVEIVDPDHADTEIYASLAQAFPGQLVDFESATRDGGQVIVSVRSDRNPGELYLYDRASGKARFLMRRREWVDPAASATVRAFAFTSRDGLRIHGYLTLPKGSDGRNLPMIVNPHGGPMGPRDSWGYNPETQLFASRGYAVLQVNYRGSGGFGKAFQDMAYGNWGTGIMSDIVDATRWAIGEGIADGNRICIYGGSFGGYAAMMAPAVEQTLFKCAFGYVGMYDAQLQYRLSDTGQREDGIAYLDRAFGKTRAEQDAMSPINHVDRIDLPVMLAAGARDPRCPPEHTEAMHAALTRAGNPPEDMIIESDEMHGFYDVENRVNLYTKMLDFFDRHIGASVDVGEVESVGSP